MNITAMLTALTDAYSEFRVSNRGLPLRKQFYALLYPMPTSGKLHIYTDAFLMAMIVLSVLAILLESVVFIESRFHFELQVFDVLTVAIFSVEYLMRIYVAPENPKFASPVVGRVRFIKSYSALIDLIAIAPFYLALFIGHLVDLRFMRIFRLARILKLTRYTSSFNTLGRVFKRELPVLGAAGFLMLLLVMLAASLGYLFEHEVQPDKFENIPQSIYWAVITLASVGYGDLSPVTPMGRMMTVVLAIVGIGIFALPAGLLSSAFTDQLRLDRERLNRMVDESLSDGVLSEEEMAAIVAEAKRLHLVDADVDYLIKNRMRNSGMTAQRRRTDVVAEPAPKPPSKASGAGNAGELIDWKQNPELAFMQLNQLIGNAKLVLAAADMERLREYFDDPARTPEHHRQIFLKLLEQTDSEASARST